MDSVEEQAIQTFQRNLEYFKKEHKNIYNKIELLNKAIEENIYIEKYALEYKDTYFDVLELSSGHYLYNEDSNEHAIKLAKSINFKKSESVLESFYRESISDDIVKKYDENSPVDGPLYATAKIIQYANKVRNEDDEMKYIDKYIFAGINLGIHIPKILEITNSNSLFLMENNLEVFRLSLFTTDYQQLSSKTKLYFSILDDDVALRDSFLEFHQYGYNYSHYLKYTILSSQDIKKVQKLQSLIITANFIAFPYSSSLQELLKAPEYLVQGYPFVNFLAHKNSSPLQDKPVIIIAAGPSLSKNIAWLKENKDKFFIIAVMASLKTLYKHNIKPDMVTHMDPRPWSVNQLDGIEETYFNETSFLFSSVVSSSVLKKLKNNNIFFFETVSHYKQNYLAVVSPSIGEVTYAVSLLLGANNLYLLGLDLALEPESRRSHSEESSDSTIIVDTLADEEERMNLHQSTSYIKGNFLEKVPITPLYRVSVAGFKDLTSLFKKENQKVHNLSNGAYLEDTIPLHSKDIDTSSFLSYTKEFKFKTINEFLLASSEKGLNERDITFLDLQITETKILLEYLKNFQKTVVPNNYDIYMRHYLKLTVFLSNHNERTPRCDINEIMYRYFYYISGYIFNIFNTKGIKNKKKHLKNINTMIIGELKKMLVLYLKTLEVYKRYV